ncbi:MAG: UMP kinase [Bacilli bacterium]|nr:UMP kinase [Bacilli bacterium]MDD4065913.1 UMP kinase [Bacilli bacterium]
MYQKVILKLSGESLGEPGAIFNDAFLSEFVKTVKEVKKLGVQLGVVIGGGNIYRGRSSIGNNIDLNQADYIGMLSTVINAVYLRELLNHHNVPTSMFSKLAVTHVVELYDLAKVKQAFAKGDVVIFGGGTGRPFCTTDTCAAERALELDADLILLAKNGVDGVYDSDPKINKNAKLYKQISYETIINQKLGIIDIGAAEKLKDSKIVSVAFNVEDMQNIVKIIKGEDVGTRIQKEA